MLGLLPERPVMLAIGLDMAEIETKTLGNVQDIAEVQTYCVEQHRGHADFVQCPHILTAAWVVRLPPAKLHAKLPSSRREFNWHNPIWGGRNCETEHYCHLMRSLLDIIFVMCHSYNHVNVRMEGYISMSMLPNIFPGINHTGWLICDSGSDSDIKLI